MSLEDDYPLLYEQAKRFDFAERLGGCTDPLLKEIDAAMRELHDARATLDTTATRPCRDCKWPLACTARGEVEPGYCLIERRALAAPDTPPDA